MKRRTLLATGGIAITSIAGCYGLGQRLSSEDTAGPSGDESDQESVGPDISAEDANSTDTPPEEREETQPENTTRNESNEFSQNQDQENTETSNESPQDAPDEDPLDAIEIVDHEMIFEEADDPQYDSDELYLQGMIRNTSDHSLQNIRLDGYAYASDRPVGHEYLEYASLEAGGERRFELPFFVENPSEVGRYKLEVTAAQWA